MLRIASGSSEEVAKEVNNRATTICIVDSSNSSFGRYDNLLLLVRQT